MKPENCSAVSSATSLPGNKAAVRFGEQLLAELGIQKAVSGESDHPALAWRRAGLLELSGAKHGPAEMVPLPVANAVDGALLALKSLSSDPEKLPINGALLLGERARLLGRTRNGRASTGGHCRLIDTAHGRFALNLARDDDWALLEAWLQEPASSWDDIERIAAERDAAMLVQRGMKMGIAIALDQLPESKPWFVETDVTARQSEQKTPLVVDLSSLWAGPMAGNLLHLMGARVIKVESHARPDGARQGNAEFYHLLNAGKQSVAFDFASAEGRADLLKLIARADIVIEASRPRALRQLGVDAEQLLFDKPGKVWLRLMAYGDEDNRIGFGDDIGVAAGLCTIMERSWGKPVFVGDAIADPVSGIFGALAAWAKWQDGKGGLIHLSMRDAVRRAMQLESEQMDWPEVATEWQALADADGDELYPMRQNLAAVEETGASTNRIMAELC